MSKIVRKDEALERALEFAKNHRPRGGFSNLYVIRLTNNDGTVVDEKYGMNLMTDYGASTLLAYPSESSAPKFPTNLYVGQGNPASNPLTTTSSTLIEQIPDFTMSADILDNTAVYSYPLYYDPNYEYQVQEGGQLVTKYGLITAVMKYKTFRFDYTKQKPDSSDFRIYEYGLGTGINQLYTHSAIYDSSGARTYITRKMADNIDIDVYLCYSYYEDVITSGWSNNRFTVIGSMELFMNRMVASNIYSYKKGNKITNRTAQTTNSGFVDGYITRTHALHEFTLTNTSSDDQGYIDGFAQKHEGYITLNPEYLPTPEAFDVVNAVNPDPTKPSGYCDHFGDNVKTPFTHVSITGVFGYDIDTHSWNNPINFTNNPNHHYCESPLQSNLGTKFWYSSNDIYVQMYVYHNIHTDDDILAIQSTAETIYAADKYWDKTTWVRITNYANIPASCKNKRYWISSSNIAADNITTTRSTGKFKLLLDNSVSDGYRSTNFEYTDTKTLPTIGDATYQYFTKGKVVFVDNPSAPYTFTVDTESDEYSRLWFKYGKWLLGLNNGGSYRSKFVLTDMTDCVTTQPTPHEYNMKFTNLVYAVNSVFTTESGTGIICLQDNGHNEANIIDIRNASFNDSTDQVLLSSKKATCIYGTNKIAYIDTNDDTNISIYDMDTKTIIQTFPLPDITNISLIYGHTNYIWFTNGSVSAVLDILTGVSNTCSHQIPVSTLSKARFANASDMFILYFHEDDDSLSNTSCFKLSNPLTWIDIKPLVGGLVSRNSFMEFRIKDVIHTDQNSVPHKTRLLILNVRYSVSSTVYGIRAVCDLGQYIDNDSVIVSYSSSVYAGAPLIEYGDYLVRDLNQFIPINNFIPLRLVGSTDTVTSINHIKRLKDKEWNITFTNKPTFGTGSNDGKVPGSSL